MKQKESYECNSEMLTRLDRAYRQTGIRSRRWELATAWSLARDHASEAERAYRRELAELDW